MYSPCFPGPTDVIDAYEVDLWLRIIEIPGFLFECHSQVCKQCNNNLRIFLLISSQILII